MSVFVQHQQYYRQCTSPFVEEGAEPNGKAFSQSTFQLSNGQEQGHPRGAWSRAAAPLQQPKTNEKQEALSDFNLSITPALFHHTYISPLI